MRSDKKNSVQKSHDFCTPTLTMKKSTCFVCVTKVRHIFYLTKTKRVFLAENMNLSYSNKKSTERV